MSLFRLLRLVLILSPVWLLLGGIAWYLYQSASGLPSRDAVRSEAGKTGRLVVVAVFDQMRGDFLERWASHFGPDGFERIKREGTWYSRTMLPYACSSTGPGHASIGTGAMPSVHGIIENDWYDRGRGKMVQSWTDEDRRYSRVPASESERAGSGVAPVWLQVPGVADELKTASEGKARCISIALKARSAVLMAGKNPSAVYCFDDRNGEFHTSSYYQRQLESWVTTFNQGGASKRWAGQTWDRLKPEVIYNAAVGPDDAAGEYAAAGPADRVFPHRLPALAGAYYPALERSPFGNELIWEFARQCIEAEKLGQRDQADLLYLGFSSNDIVGHAFGPDSHEVMDITLRSDQLVAQMLRYLDERLGKDRYCLIITADHGICPTPEAAAKTHPTARRIGVSELVQGLDQALDDTFGPPDGIAGRWVEGDFSKTFPWLYLNARTIQASGVPAGVVRDYVRSWLGNRPNALTAFTRQQIESDAADELLTLVRNAYHPERSGDVYLVLKPYVLVSGGFSTGTNHGSPHPYDRHIALLAMGEAVPALGQRTEVHSSLIIAPWTARLLGVKPPSAARVPLPAELQPRAIP